MKKDATSAPTQPRTSAQFTSVKTRRGFEEVGDQIRAMLHSGELKAGDRLPSEQDLATGFGVSRPVIREALRTLEMAGILELKLGTKGGAYIRNGNAEMLARPLQDLIALGRISIPNLIDARRMIHSVILQSACEHGTAADFAAIEARLGRPVPDAYRKLYRDIQTIQSTNIEIIPPGTHSPEDRWPIVCFFPADQQGVTDLWPGQLLNPSQLPFATDGSGGLYYLELQDPNASDPSVWFYHWDGEVRAKITESLSEFLSWRRAVRAS